MAGGGRGVSEISKSASSLTWYLPRGLVLMGPSNKGFFQAAPPMSGTDPNKPESSGSSARQQEWVSGAAWVFTEPAQTD